MSAGCCVCGLSDARALVVVPLKGGLRVTLCGTHDLVHRRAGGRARSVAELKQACGERRSEHRRARPKGDHDELAQRLSDAFTKERRATERRAG